MVEVYGIEFEENSKIYFFDANEKNYKINTFVIVETEKGIQIGKIITDVKKVDKGKYKNLKKILREADDKDLKILEENKNDSTKAKIKAEKLAKKMELNMKIINASYTFDRTQLFITFISDNRVDFRNLAKELASIYKTRIELRQIGIRDKAREVSGIGICGRKLCCSSFLKSIDSVSINMVKNQNLSLNPNKINGQCGRLLCCLNYEDEIYTEFRKDLPNIGDEIKIKDFNGKVTSIDILNKSFIITNENKEKREVKK